MSVRKLFNLTVFVVAISLVTTPAAATIITGEVTSGSGSFVKLSVPFTESTPDNTVGDNNFNDLNLYAFDEGQNIVITSNLSVDLLADGLGGSSGSGTLFSGTIVASHYIAYDPGGSVSIRQQGYIDFDSDILAVITSSTKLDSSDFLINTGVDYLSTSLRGLESGDSVTIAGLRRVAVNWSASNPGDYIRVLTQYSPSAAVPLPSVALLLMAGLLGIERPARRVFINRRPKTDQ